MSARVCWLSRPSRAGGLRPGSVAAAQRGRSEPRARKTNSPTNYSLLHLRNKDLVWRGEWGESREVSSRFFLSVTFCFCCLALFMLSPPLAVLCARAKREQRWGASDGSWLAIFQTALCVRRLKTTIKIDGRSVRRAPTVVPCAWVIVWGFRFTCYLYGCHLVFPLPQRCWFQACWRIVVFSFLFKRSLCCCYLYDGMELVPQWCSILTRKVFHESLPVLWQGLGYCCLYDLFPVTDSDLLPFLQPWTIPIRTCFLNVWNSWQFEWLD